MTPIELAAVLTALGSVLGAAWTVYSGRNARHTTEQSSMWNEAMQLIDKLEVENKRLRDQLSESRAQLEESRRWNRRGQRNNERHDV